MAVGKNKRLSKKGKGGGRKKKADAFEKKKWMKLKLPKCFRVNHYGWTVANKTQAGILIEDRLKDRICTIRCGDLEQKPQPDSAEGTTNAMNVLLRIARTTTESSECWLDFYGMQLTRDKTCQMIRKWVSLIDAVADIRTSDGFIWRLHAMALTKKQDAQCKKTAYAQTSQIKRIRKTMVEIMTREFNDKTTRELVDRLLIGAVGREIEKAANFIFPVQNACIRKVRLLKRPAKENQRRIDELHSEEVDPELEDVELDE